MNVPAAKPSEQGARAQVRRRNPYRGPMEFGRRDRLPNRQREARELADLVIADRVVLLHAPSGAGKTSLIEAAVVHELQAEGFHPTPRLRVNQPPADDGTNRYTSSLVTYMLQAPTNGHIPSSLSLRAAVERWTSQDDAGDRRTVLILDQLEEVLVLDPTDWAVKEEFFRSLGELLSTEPLWALLSMREDYMGGMDRYLRFLPGLLQSRYRLDFLTPHDARLAIKVPASDQMVDFKDDAAEALVDKLVKVRVEQTGKVETKEAPYVEPFQLQVACRQLWKKVRSNRGDDFPTIEVSDVEAHSDIDQALTLYYGDTVANVVQRTGAVERAIRDWFETELITGENYRSQTLNPPDTINSIEVVSLLEEGYLIRGDVRGMSTWYELTHDRLIGPVHTSNETWRREKLALWQTAAYKWAENDRRPAYLLQASELPSASVRRAHLTELERDFLKQSEAEAARQGGMARVRGIVSALIVLVIVQAVVIVLLVLYLAFG